MKSTGPNFALQLKPNESLFHDAGEVLGSKKADIKLADGTTKSVTVFFRVPADQLAKLQARKQADSLKVTAESFKKFLIERGVTPANADVAMKKISDELSQTRKEGKMLRRQSEKSMRKQGLLSAKSDYQRRPSVANLKENFQMARQKRLKENSPSQPQIPAGLFSKAFDKAIKDGNMARVDPDLKQDAPAKPVQKAKPLPTPPARKAAKPLPLTPQRSQPQAARQSEFKLTSIELPPLPDLPEN